MIPSVEKLAMSFVLVACHRGEGNHAIADPHADAASAAASAVPVASASSVREAGPPPHMLWRVVDHRYVADDAGYPREMWTEVQLEVAGKVFGPWRFGAPACTLGSSTDKHGVAKLTCYYGGSGEYVEVIEKKTGEYAIVTYGQDEGYADEPAPRKEGMKTLGTFKTTDPLDEAIVSADGGMYTAYGP